MHTNVIPFPANRTVPPVDFDDDTYDNVVSLTRWRAQAQPHRTSNGVFFVSHIHGFDGDAA
ncbi:MAG: hypothetical protein QNJ16_06445 [Rhodobacter sp.]|nr:hypothetical protein [Rhodobacter sp.]